MPLIDDLIEFAVLQAAQKRARARIKELNALIAPQIDALPGKVLNSLVTVEGESETISAVMQSTERSTFPLANLLTVLDLSDVEAMATVSQSALAASSLSPAIWMPSRVVSATPLKLVVVSSIR